MGRGRESRRPRSERWRGGCRYVRCAAHGHRSRQRRHRQRKRSPWGAGRRRGRRLLVSVPPVARLRSDLVRPPLARPAAVPIRPSTCCSSGSVPVRRSRSRVQPALRPTFRNHRTVAGWFGSVHARGECTASLAAGGLKATPLALNRKGVSRAGRPSHLRWALRHVARRPRQLSAASDRGGARYLYATAALVGPASGMISVRVKPASSHQPRKSAPV